MLRQRLIFGSLMALAVLALLWVDAHLAARTPPTWPILGANAGHWLYNGAVCTGLVLVLVILAVRELAAIARAAGYRPYRFATTFFAMGFVLGPYVSHNMASAAEWKDESWAVLWLAIALSVTFLIQAVRRGTERVLVNISTSTFIMLYAGAFAGFMTKLRMEVGGAEGVVVLLFSMFLVKITDVGAYFTGRAIGRTKLIPWLSPKKTWEGLAGGVLTAALCSIGVGTWIARAGGAPTHQAIVNSPLMLAILGVVMAVFSILGDLAESLLKRDADVKDSGTLIPGMGGILDVIDSPLLSAPAAWFFWTRVAPLFESTH